MAKTGLYAGSFDPIHRGHVAVIEDALTLFDRLIIAIATNPTKNHLISEIGRLMLVKTVLEKNGFKRLLDDRTLVVEFAPQSQYTAQFAVENGVTHLVRGVRGTSDMTQEIITAHFNHSWTESYTGDPGINTVFIPARYYLQDISSTLVRSLIGYQTWQETLLRETYLEVIEYLEKYHDHRI
jgi:pantetheine-phosphate adenylyltransferase